MATQNENSKTFVIKHDTQRYGDNTEGLRRFGARVIISGVIADQAEAIADAMSSYSDAGLTDQYVVESPENTPSLAIAEYSRLTQKEFRDRVLGSEFAASIDAAIPGGPVPVVRECGISAGPVICPHGKVEVFCSECDLKARVELHDAVALAVMAERERCAKIAEGWGWNLETEADGSLIADKIRSGQ